MNRAAKDTAFITLTPAKLTATVTHRYEGFWRTLKLNPEQMARLRTLLTARQQAAIDAANASIQQGMNHQKYYGLVREAIASAETPFAGDLTALIGADAYGRLQEWEQNAPERNTVDNLRSLLSATTAPLSPQQTADMLRVVTSTEEADSSGGIGRAVFGGVNYHSRLTPQTIVAAKYVLDAPQVDVLQQMLTEQQRTLAPKAASR